MELYPLSKAITIPRWRGLLYRIFGRKIVVSQDGATLTAYQLGSTLYVHSHTTP